MKLQEFIILLISILVFTACKSPQKELYKDSAQVISKAKIGSTYERDSLYLDYTVKEFMKTGYYRFSGFKTFNIPVEKTKVFIDSIFYSPDSLKIFAFVIIEMPKNEGRKQENSDPYFNGHSLIGFRDNKTQPWKIYEFLQYSASAWDTYDEVHKAFRNYYFREFKDASEYNLDTSGKWELNYFKYNLNEPEFWTKSNVWQKGLRIPGYYNFQLKGKYRAGEEKRGVVPYLEIQYPDSLLKRFK